ncbi:MAG: hypothetical protein ISS15_02035 [Alphaproteobacteria bacterium]|nr:hypothetical protein [Alphaproteobacteria bacterium]MBL7096411.1 hypothetical protein [Alphaproteobacteria bacterium]
MFYKTIGLASALVLASAIPAFAASACSEPIAPAALNGATATTAQMNAARDDVMTFLKQSDDYQLCLLKEEKDANDAAVKAKKDPDPALDADTKAKILANQSLKEKVGAEFNTAVGDYKKAHPG